MECEELEKKVKFQTDKWASQTPLQNTVTKPLLDLQLNKKVTGYQDMERWWNEFQKDIPMKSLLQLASIYLFPYTSFLDTIAWAGNANGQFSIGSTSSLLMNYSTRSPNPLWNTIWRLEAPERVRTFIWLVGHNKILSNKLSASRGIMDDASCKVCGALLESLLHIIRDCVITGKVWDRILPSPYQAKFFSMDFLNWTRANIIQGKFFYYG